jgi:hypothetical protein
LYDNNPITLLNLVRLPARVDYQGAAVLLNFEVVSLKALVELGHLKPTGNPKGTEHRYFCTKTILKLGDDEKWISEATRAVSKYWAGRNQNRKLRPREEAPVRRIPE